MKKCIKFLMAFMGTILIVGCGPVISKNVLQQIDSTIVFDAVFQDPEAFKDKSVLWGGVIISIKNLKEGTLIEVLQKPLDYFKAPKDGDASGGRFLALYDGYLDAAVYSKGRKITLAGTIIGRRIQRLDEIDYAYPHLLITEIHLWQEINKEVGSSSPLFYPYPYRYYFWHHYPYFW